MIKDKEIALPFNEDAPSVSKALNKSLPATYKLIRTGKMDSRRIADSNIYHLSLDDLVRYIINPPKIEHSKRVRGKDVKPRKSRKRN